MPLLGTSRRPVFLRACTFEEADRLLDLCEAHGWEAIVGVDEDAPSDLPQLERSLVRDGFTTEITSFQLPSANSPCPCGSGRKFKRCCRPAA